MPDLFKSPTGLKDQVKKKIASTLQPRLADSIHFHMIVKSAHWNVKGENFKAAHTLFDELAESIEKYIDQIAERITTLVGKVEADIVYVQKTSKVIPCKPDIVYDHDYLEEIGTKLTQLVIDLRRDCEVLGSSDDYSSVNVVYDYVQDLEKFGYFINAMVAEPEYESKGE